MYQNLNKKDRADLKDKALTAIRRNQLINEEQTKQVHQENNRLMTVKALDKQLTRQEIRDALNANQISVSNAENLIKNINNAILIFNLMPIYPLDGGKIINNILNINFGHK